MKYSFSENLADRKGVVSNLHGFLNRYLDTGFKTKWSGFWVPPYKYMDYFAFKVNGIWLDSDTLEGVEYGEDMIFYHETGSLSIEEHIKAPEGLPGLNVRLKIRNKNQERKAVQAVLETGVDIRHKSDDVPEADYTLEEGTDRINIRSQDRNLVVETEQEFSVQGESYVKEHEPGERQECFVPGEIVFREEIPAETTGSIELNFITSDASFKDIREHEQELRNQALGRTFSYSVESMKNLVYDRQGTGLIAGHPWFQEYWARDTFWTLLGLIDAGYFDLSRDILENFAEKDLNSKIDLENGEGDGMAREDTYPLFVIAADKLRRHDEISEDIEEAVDEAFEKLDTENGVVRHDAEATWMDTLERSPAVDVQSLWLKAAGIEGREVSEDLAEGLKNFKTRGYLRDSLSSDSPTTINPAVPLMFGQIGEKDAESCLEKINGEFSSMYGARTRAVTDPGYSGDGYHEGAVWGLTTGWAAAANLEYGSEKQGRNFLEKMTQFVDRNQPGALPEVVDAETGELLGCSEQAWSAGLYVHVIDSYLLGIQVRDEKVVIDPSEEFTGKRLGKRIGEERLDIRFEEGEVEILNNPELEIDIRE